MSEYTSRLERLKQVWAAKGSQQSMSEGEWNCLLDELLDEN